MASNKLDLWRDHLKTFASSGMSGSEYCRQHSLADASFYKWRRRLAEEESSEGFDEVSVVEEIEEAQRYMIDLGKLDHKVLCLFVQSLVAEPHA